MNSIKLTRKELYDLVWSSPFTALAKKYLISDVGLRKMCIGMEVPFPKSGHWVKAQFNKPTEKIELPTNYSGEKEVTLNLREEGDESLKGVPSPEIALKEKIEKDPLLNITVPDTLTKPHKLIVETKKAHLNNENRHSKNFTGYLRSPLSISGTKLNYNRALRIMDTFIKAMEQRGHVFQLRNDSVHLVMYGEEFEISIREKNKRIAKPKTNSWQEYDYIPSGILAFVTKINWSNVEWKDGKLPLENQLSNIIAKFEIKGAEKSEQTIRMEKENEIREEQNLIKRAKEQEIENELMKFRVLKKKAELWREASEIRAYLGSIEEKAIKEQSLTDELKDWLKWAHKKADWYDPIMAIKDELMEGVDKGNLTFKKSGYY